MRKVPYTEIGIRRLKCFRCNSPAKYQWQICSDGNVYHPLCPRCDVELNEMVLQFMGFEDWKEKMIIYRELKL